MLGILFKSSWSFSPKEQNTDMYTDTKKWSNSMVTIC
jgi:hypothetical protein